VFVPGTSSTRELHDEAVPHTDQEKAHLARPIISHGVSQLFQKTGEVRDLPFLSLNLAFSLSRLLQYTVCEYGKRVHRRGGLFLFKTDKHYVSL
jgi:hypothetical protein